MDARKLKVLKEVMDFYKQKTAEENEFYKLLSQDPDAQLEFRNLVTNWSEFYSLSFVEFLAIFIILSGATPLLAKANEEKSRLDNQLSFLDQMKNFEISTHHLQQFMSEEEASKLMMQLTFALNYNMKAFAHRNRPINTMLEQIREKVEDYEEIIFEAISIDPSVVSNSEIADFIARWTAERNEANLVKLSKAIVGKYPRGKRTVGLDNYRMMVSTLEELEGKISAEAIDEMNSFLNLIAEGEDLDSAIRKHLQTRKHDTRKSKRQTTS